MKKFTFMLLAAFIAVTAMAGTEKSLMRAEMFPAKAQIGQKLNLKQAPGKAQVSKRARAPKKAETFSAANLVGDYTWDYLQASSLSTQPDTLATTAGTAHVVISESTTTEGGITISGMFPNDLEATVGTDGDYNYFTISAEQTGGTSSYGDYILYGLFYYEGDETYEAGWYDGDIHGYVLDDGSIYIDEWICRVLSTGSYVGYNLTPYWLGGSTLTPSDPLTVITFPEGVVANDYVMTYNGGSKPVKVAVDGSDVYIQGLSQYCPEACVKGTKGEDNKVTFPAMQYMGVAYDMTSYFFYEGDAVFTYDPETDTYTLEGNVYGVLGNQYYDGNYTNPVIAPVAEKAVMPANPEITALQSSSYGMVLDFNIPLEDVNGDPILGSKLTYIIYTDVERKVTPLTFTPATHSELEEDMTEIPYGFTENYDFYAGRIYLNDLYSEDWNKIGIQSIYYGGGETNATEIQWFTIKEYTTGDFTFNFNEMDVATSNNLNEENSNDGDILEVKELKESSVTLAISPKTESASNPNRFWATTNGPQLRMYSSTLTFTVPKGYIITGIKFYHNGYWGGKNNGGNVSVDSGAITNDATNKVATWVPAEGVEGAETVIFTIGANTQIDQITVTVEEAPEVAATPAAPTFNGLQLVGTSYPKFWVNVPTEDVDGYPINAEKLYYTIWYELYGGKAQQFVVSADEYEYVTEDMVEVPYSYGDDWDIYEDDGDIRFYLNPADFDYTAWKRIGVQSIYYGADERRESEITWITPVSVTAAKYATFVAPVDVDFTDNAVSAYAATFDGEYVQLAPVTTVPAGTAVVVKAEYAGTYVVNETTDATLGATNELVASTEDVTADGTQYVLAKVDDVVGFYKVNTGSTIAAGKGYMVFETAVKPFYAFGEDDATAISRIAADENAIIYNLAGQRVSKAVKGINIINGKKVLK
ncbi:MAG: hypothetical protein IKU02_05725 [Bacteroidaceae bacterium]|nr:hypothetical protein [Bacteroidaceae bacterium]